ncbi:MAG: hypothetical protein ACT4PJ_05235 [Gemmatimonadaceae bacterium]
MAYTEFTDRAGRCWRVWRTVPRVAELLTTLPADWKDGWLTFESDGEKRRLAPVPSGWEDFPPERLELLCKMARPASSEPGSTGSLRRHEERTRPPRGEPPR